MPRLQRKKTCVFNISYHLIWCPKYRRKVLINEVEARLKELLLEKASELKTEIVEMEVMPDHVHIFVKTLPTYAPADLVGKFKGYTARKLRLEFPHLKKQLPCLWTRSYYCESIGHISEHTIRKYIRDQKNR